MIAGIPASLEQADGSGAASRSSADRGRFAAPNAVAVGDEMLEARHIVIATGSTPRRLPFPGAELMITSDDVLSEREHCRASVLRRRRRDRARNSATSMPAPGVQVTDPRGAARGCSPVWTPMRPRSCARETERIGVAVHTGVEIERIERAGRGLRVVYEAGWRRTIEADRVVNGAGRVPDVDGLDLAAGQVPSERGALRGCLFALDIEPGRLGVRGCRRESRATVADCDVRRSDRRPQHRRRRQVRARLQWHSIVRLYVPALPASA